MSHDGRERTNRLMREETGAGEARRGNSTQGAGRGATLA